MIELVIVIAIVGVLAASAIPMWSDNARSNLDITRRRIVTDLAYAREIAMQQHQAVVATFDPSANRYDLRLASTGAALADPSNPGASLSFALDGSGNSGGVGIESASFGGTPGVRFDSWGVPADTSGAALAAAGVVILSSGAYRDTVRIEPRTGFVR